MTKSVNHGAVQVHVYHTITMSTVEILSCQAERSVQIEETEIRLLISNHSDHGLHSCHSICASLQALLNERMTAIAPCTPYNKV